MTEMLMPTNISQLRSWLGGLSYYRKFLPNLSKRILRITDLLKKGDTFIFTKDMEVIVRDSLKTLTEKPVRCFLNWDAVQDGSRLFQLHNDASLESFGAVLNQPQLDGSVRPILYINRATLPDEVNWSPP